MSNRVYAIEVDDFISVNDAYQRVFGRGRDRRLSDSAVKYKELIAERMSYIDSVLYGGIKFSNDPEDPSKRWILCSYFFSFKWSSLYQGDSESNDIYSKDNSNYFKLIEDAIFEYLGINDKYVSTIAGSKLISREVLGIDKNFIILIIENRRGLPHPGEDFSKLVLPAIEVAIGINKLVNSSEEKWDEQANCNYLLWRVKIN